MSLEHGGILVVKHPAAGFLICIYVFREFKMCSHIFMSHSIYVYRFWLEDRTIYFLVDRFFMLLSYVITVNHQVTHSHHSLAQHLSRKTCLRAHFFTSHDVCVDEYTQPHTPCGTQRTLTNTHSQRLHYTGDTLQ